MKRDLARTLEAAIDVFDGLGLKYAVVGGLAIGAWGVTRATRDVDLYADLPAAQRPVINRELEARGFDVPALEQELSRFGVFRARSEDGVFLDVFSAVGPLGAAILENRKQIVTEGRPIWFIAAED